MKNQHYYRTSFLLASLLALCSLFSACFDFRFKSITEFEARAFAAPGETIPINARIKVDQPTDSSEIKIYLSKDRWALPGEDIQLKNDFLGIKAEPLSFYEYLTSVTIPANTNPGDYFIIITTPFYQALEEEHFYKPIKITGMPLPGIDLMATNVLIEGKYYGSKEYLTNTKMLVQLSLENLCSNPASASTMKFWASKDAILDNQDALWASVSTPLIPPISKIEVATYITIPPNAIQGVYYLFVVSDANDAVSEINESNNVVLRYFSVRERKPDLVVSDVKLPALCISGQKFKYSAIVQNQQYNIAESPTTTLKLFISTDDLYDQNDQPLAILPVAGLGTKDSFLINQSLEIPLWAKTGTYYLLTKVDPDNQIRESDKVNNFLAVRTFVINTQQKPNGESVDICENLSQYLSEQDPAKQEDYAKSSVAERNRPNDQISMAASFKAYPNPATDYVTIALQNPVATDVNIAVSDLSGRNMHSMTQHVPAGRYEKTIDVSMMPAGTYMISATIGRRLFTQKIVVAK